MAKKAAAAKPASAPAPESGKKLIDAIVAVKHLQGFITAHGGVLNALESVSRVKSLVELTGGFDPLVEALKVVGDEPSNEPVV